MLGLLLFGLVSLFGLDRCLPFGAIALKGLTWLGRGAYWYSCRASGGSSHFVRGDGSFVQLFIICF